MLSGADGSCRVPVQVQALDLYRHFGAFSLVWVPSMDLYEHLHSEVVIVQISFVQEIARRTNDARENPHPPSFPMNLSLSTINRIWVPSAMLPALSWAAT